MAMGLDVDSTGEGGGGHLSKSSTVFENIAKLGPLFHYCTATPPTS